jgi:hypothetical protein
MNKPSNTTNDVTNIYFRTTIINNCSSIPRIQLNVSNIFHYPPPFTTNPKFHPHDYNTHHTTQIQHDINTKHLHTNQRYNSFIYF